jgi:hypothetical protein
LSELIFIGRLQYLGTFVRGHPCFHCLYLFPEGPAAAVDIADIAINFFDLLNLLLWREFVKCRSEFVIFRYEIYDVTCSNERATLAA